MVIFLLIVLIVEIGVVAWLVLRSLKQQIDYAEFTHGHLVKKLEQIDGEVQKKGSVTPPIVAANKTHTVGASGRHIVIRKTPDQIRAENAEAIRSGAASYGRPTE